MTATASLTTGELDLPPPLPLLLLLRPPRTLLLLLQLLPPLLCYACACRRLCAETAANYWQ
jgi:hypothetical protein